MTKSPGAGMAAEAANAAVAGGVAVLAERELRSRMGLPGAAAAGRITVRENDKTRPAQREKQRGFTGSF